MKAWLLILSCMVIAGCKKPPAADSPRSQNTASNADTKSGEVLFDLLKDTAQVSEALAGTWYQLDHSRDGATTSLSLVRMFADGTVRDEYWTLVHKERIALHGTEEGRWQLRGDTIAFHFEGKPAAAASAPATPSATPSVTAAPSAAAAPPAAAASPAPAAAVVDGADKPHDDEQRILQATKDWFTYEYRNGVSSPPASAEPESVLEGVSVRVANDFKLPRSIRGYRLEGKEASALEKMIKKLFR